VGRLNARREEARLLFHIRALADLSAEIASAHDLPTTAKSSLMMIGGTVSAAKGVLLLWDRAEGRLETLVHRGLSAREAAMRVPLTPAVSEALRQMNAATPVEAEPEGADRFACLLREAFPEMVVYAPLVVREELLGVLALGPKLTRAAYEEDDLELIFALATMVASGIHSHRLIQGLQESNQRLREAHEQLLAAERLATLGELSAGIAHEIKNPLTSIRGFAVTIAEAVCEARPEEIREYAEIIVDASDQLRMIIDEVRDYAKGVRRTYEVEPVGLKVLAEEVLSFTRFSRELRLVDTRLVCEADGIVRVNRDKIKQVLLNLLKNAAQAIENPRAGRIRLSVTTTDGWGTIAVADNGCGIPEESREKIWQNWFSTKGVEGTGLGLGIARRIVEEHGGTLELLHSEVGVGSTFAIRLPLATAGEDGTVGESSSSLASNVYAGEA
jgi:signal transduction histidine kinase